MESFAWVINFTSYEIEYNLLIIARLPSFTYTYLYITIFLFKLHTHQHQVFGFIFLILLERELPLLRDAIDNLDTLDHYLEDFISAGGALTNDCQV